MELNTNLGRISLVPKGEYNPAIEYERLDIVQYQGSGYIVLKNVQGILPEDGANYMLLAQGAELNKIFPSGGQSGQVLTKTDSGNEWTTPITLNDVNNIIQQAVLESWSKSYG